MTPETIDLIVKIFAAIFGVAGIAGVSVGGGIVSARLTKQGLARDYRLLFEEQAVNVVNMTRRTEKLEMHLQEQVRSAAQTAKETVILQANQDLIERQRTEQETRHAGEIASLHGEFALLKAENAQLQKDLAQALHKLTETEKWVDMLKTRLNPPPLTERQTDAIDALRETPPASDKTGMEG